MHWSTITTEVGFESSATAAPIATHHEHPTVQTYGVDVSADLEGSFQIAILCNELVNQTRNDLKARRISIVMCAGLAVIQIACYSYETNSCCSLDWIIFHKLRQRDIAFHAFRGPCAYGALRRAQMHSKKAAGPDGCGEGGNVMSEPSPISRAPYNVLHDTWQGPPYARNSTRCGSNESLCGKGVAIALVPKHSPHRIVLPHFIEPCGVSIPVVVDVLSHCAAILDL